MSQVQDQEENFVLVGVRKVHGKVMSFYSKGQALYLSVGVGAMVLVSDAMAADEAPTAKIDTMLTNFLSWITKVENIVYLSIGIIFAIAIYRLFAKGLGR